MQCRLTGEKADARPLPRSITLYGTGRHCHTEPGIVRSIGLVTSQLIVTYRSGRDLGEGNAVQRATQIATLSRAAGVHLSYIRRMSGERQHVLRLPGRLPLDEARQIAERLRATAAVLDAEPDEVVYPLARSERPALC